MQDEQRLEYREWIWLSIFLILLLSFLAIAYISDRQVDKEVERYLHPTNSE